MFRIERMLPLITLFLFLPFTAGCTNYTSETPDVAIPILTGIEKSGSGHIIRMSAMNTEVGFVGYRLYNGGTEIHAQSPDDSIGIDCTSLSNLPNRAVEYYIRVTMESKSYEADEDSTEYLCTIPLTLSSGSWIAMRSLIFKNLGTLDKSEPSNALPVP